MRYLLGIDIGTSSVKSLLIGEEGTVAGIAKMEYDIKKPQQSWAKTRRSKRTLPVSVTPARCMGW